MSRTVHETCLEQLRTVIPEALLLADAPARSLLQYARMMCGSRAKAPQDGDDLISCACGEASRLFSPNTAKALRRELEDRFCALTANHVGMDTHPEFIQGNLIFALGNTRAVPLFACGCVPADNASFPRGLLLAPRCAGSTVPFRLPLLSNRDRRAFVGARQAFEAAQVEKTLSRLDRTPLSAQEQSAVTGLVSQTWLHPTVLRQSAFRDQMSVANGLLWKSLTKPPLALPPLISLTLEELARQLILADTQKPHGLIHDLLLEPALTLALFRELNGTRGCWTVGTDRRMEKGSFLFWAVDAKQRGQPLTLAQDGRTLVCPDRSGLSFSLSMPELADALRAGRLLPSLYLSFAVLALARGLGCAGGVFQAAYLPRMAQGTARALRQCRENALADHITASSPLCTGMLPLRVPFSTAGSPKNADIAAGAVDILMAGGLTEKNWAELAAVRVRDAVLCALPYHYEDLIPEKEREPGWMQTLPPPLLL